jgi:hypothetical protein
VTITPRAGRGSADGRDGRAGRLQSETAGGAGRAGRLLEQALIGEPGPGSPGGFVPMFTGSISAMISVFSPSGLADIVAQVGGQQERGVEGAVSLVGAASLAGQVSGGCDRCDPVRRAVRRGERVHRDLQPAAVATARRWAPGRPGDRTVGQRRAQAPREADGLHGRPAGVAAVAIPVIALLLVFMVLLCGWTSRPDPAVTDPQVRAIGGGCRPGRARGRTNVPAGTRTGRR